MALAIMHTETAFWELLPNPNFLPWIDWSKLLQDGVELHLGSCRRKSWRCCSDQYTLSTASSNVADLWHIVTSFLIEGLNSSTKRSTLFSSVSTNFGANQERRVNSLMYSPTVISYCFKLWNLAFFCLVTWSGINFSRNVSRILPKHPRLVWSCMADEHFSIKYLQCLLTSKQLMLPSAFLYTPWSHTHSPCVLTIHPLVGEPPN